MWKVNGRQTTESKWWQKLTLTLARWAKKEGNFEKDGWHLLMQLVQLFTLQTFKNLFYRVHTICKSKNLFVSSSSSSISSSIFVLTFCGSTLGFTGRSSFISGLSYPHNKHKVLIAFNLMAWVSVRLDGHRGDWIAK